MNVFVVLIPEEYDQYEILMPYPIITNMTKQNCIDWFVDIADAACEYLNMEERKRRYLPIPEFNVGTYVVSLHQITRRDDNNKYVPVVLQVLELNEWLLKANINSNREKPNLE